MESDFADSVKRCGSILRSLFNEKLITLNDIFFVVTIKYPNKNCHCYIDQTS